MAESMTVSCPICKYLDNYVHSLRIFTMVPMRVGTDDSLEMAVGICERSGKFVWRTSDGWQMQVTPTSTEYLGSDLEIEDDETNG